MNEPFNLWSEEQEDWVNRVQRARCTIAQLCSIKVVSAIKTSLLFNCRFLPEGRGGLREETTIINIHFLKKQKPTASSCSGEPANLASRDCFNPRWLFCSGLMHGTTMQLCFGCNELQNCSTSELSWRTASKNRVETQICSRFCFFLLLLECDVYEILQRPGFARQSWSHCLSCCTAVLVTSKIGKLQTTHSVRRESRAQ